MHLDQEFENLRTYDKEVQWQIAIAGWLFVILLLLFIQWFKCVLIILFGMFGSFKLLYKELFAFGA